jgi:hypothetical protein
MDIPDHIIKEAVSLLLQLREERHDGDPNRLETDETAAKARSLAERLGLYLSGGTTKFETPFGCWLRL